MPALFAYLLSITVFVAAGYAGLVWLTEPPPAKPSATPTVASAHSPKARAELAAADNASPQESAASSSDPAARAPSAPAQQPPAAVAAGSEVKPKQPAQEAAQQARQLPRQDWKEAHDAADRADGATPVPALRSGRNVATTIEHEQPARGRETLPMLPKPVLSPKAAKAVAQWFGAVAAERHAKPKPREPVGRAKLHSLREASRSRYVMMTLRTIEYPDGHREQRLLPLRQFWADSD